MNSRENTVCVKFKSFNAKFLKSSMKELESPLIRGIGVAISAFANLSLATIILNEFGDIGFGIYATLISLMSLLIFGDLGLGTGIFNLYTKRDSKTEEDSETGQFVSVTFICLSIFAVTLAIGITCLDFAYDWNFINSNLSNETADFSILAILILTSFAIPFSIGSRKLQATERIRIVLIIQSIIPIINLVCISILNESFDVSPLYLSVIPASVYLFSTIGIFFASGVWKVISFENFKNGLHLIRSTIKLGGWVTCFAIPIGYLWLIPRFMLSEIGKLNEVASYSLMMMILTPSISIINAYAQQMAPVIKRVQMVESKKYRIKRSVIIACIIALTLSIMMFIGSIVAGKLGMAYPNFNEIFLIAVTLFISVFWQIPAAALTEILEVKWLVIRFTPCFISIFTLNLFLKANNITWLFLTFILPNLVCLVFLVWRRIRIDYVRHKNTLYDV